MAKMHVMDDILAAAFKKGHEKLEITAKKPMVLNSADLNLDYGLLLWSKGDKDTALKYIMDAISQKPEYSQMFKKFST